MRTAGETRETLPQKQGEGENPILKSRPGTSSATAPPPYIFKKTQALATGRKRTEIH